MDSNSFWLVMGWIAIPFVAFYLYHKFFADSDIDAGARDTTTQMTNAYSLLVLIVGAVFAIISLLYIARDVSLWLGGTQSTAYLERVKDVGCGKRASRNKNCRYAYYQFSHAGKTYHIRGKWSLNYTPPTVHIRFLPFWPEIHKITDSVYYLDDPSEKYL